MTGKEITPTSSPFKEYGWAISNGTSEPELGAYRLRSGNEEVDKRDIIKPKKGTCKGKEIIPVRIYGAEPNGRKETILTQDIKTNIQSKNEHLLLNK